ncbi:MAG: UDP-N-acetylmuramate dehydrogenase [Candidatus Obscuribacterales bacterium]|nr:UDP-N-acetylmuramate dehydrogenase [Candidatus Obscuribacterales bacterium]
MEIADNSPLWRYTTMKVGGDAEHFCQPAGAQELVDVLDLCRKQRKPWHILGGGSNTLISSAGVPGTVIRMTQMTNVQTLEEDLVEAEAGTRLPHIAKHAASLGLSGLEFAVGIPGTIGGAVVMNAGAHGSCMSEIVESVTVFDIETWQIRVLSNKELSFEYRNSAIDPQKQIVLSAKLRMKKDSAEKIKAQTQHNEDYRWRTQPIGTPNLGSTFKNPLPDKSAGFLLDQSGAKEMQEGQAAVSALHANFVVNLGGATSQNIVGLLHRMQNLVQEKHALHLHPEWKTLGLFTPEEHTVWK